MANDYDRICLGPWVDVWSYIIQHVKSESSVSVVKGNLKLNAKVHIQVIMKFNFEKFIIYTINRNIVGQQ